MLGVRRGRLGAGARRPASTGASVVGAGSALPAARRGRGGRGVFLLEGAFSRGRSFGGPREAGRRSSVTRPPARYMDRDARARMPADRARPPAGPDPPAQLTHTFFFCFLFFFCFPTLDSRPSSSCRSHLGLEAFFFVSRGPLSASSSSSSGRSLSWTEGLGRWGARGERVLPRLLRPTLPAGGWRCRAGAGRRAVGCAPAAAGAGAGGGFGDGTGRGWLPALQLRGCG